MTPIGTGAPLSSGVLLYDMRSAADRQRFGEAITRLPAVAPVRPWQGTDLEAIIAEATQAGIYADKMPKYHQEALQLGLIQPGQTLDSVVVEYPWNTADRFVAVPPREILYAINFSRNACIIGDSEQQALAGARVGIAGLSVGGVAGTLLVRTGFLRIIGADGGLVDGKDLNRSGFGTAASVGLPQAHAFARACLAINPFADIRAIHAHLGSDAYGVEEFVRDADIVVDEVDALEVKWAIRVAAKQQQKAVVMGTDLGCASLLQVEPPEVPPFFGSVSEAQIADYRRDPADHLLKTRIALAMLGGPDKIPPHYARALAEAQQRRLGYWPQVGEAALLTAALICRAVRRALTGPVEPVELLVDLERR